jgi:hypothetical protein
LRNSCVAAIDSRNNRFGHRTDLAPLKLPMWKTRVDPLSKLPEPGPPLPRGAPLRERYSISSFFGCSVMRAGEYAQSRLLLIMPTGDYIHLLWEVHRDVLRCAGRDSYEEKCGRPHGCVRSTPMGSLPDLRRKP